MMQLLAEIRCVMGPGHKGSVLLLVFGLSFVGLVEVLGIGSILPFLAVSADPDLVHSNVVLGKIFHFFGFPDVAAFIVCIGVVSLLLVTLGNVLNLAVAWAVTRFAIMQGQRISSFLLERHLTKPYEYYYRHSIADLVGQIFLEVRKVTSGVLQPLVTMLSRVATILAIFGLLLYVDTYVTLAVALFFSSFYYLLFRFYRDSLYQLGKRAAEGDAARVKNAIEALGAIKEVKTFKAEKYFLELFEKTSSVVSNAESKAFLAAHGPRYALEALAFGALVIVALTLTLRPDGGRHVIPLLALFGFAGYRLLPAIQQVFTGAASVRFNRGALERVAEEFARRDFSRASEGEPEAGTAFTTTDWKKIEFVNVGVRFDGRPVPGLDDIHLTVRRGMSIGVMGKTGAGKSTLIDVLAGLIEPTTGSLYVDGVPLSRMRKRWLDCIGYVPQTPHFLDATLAENIAFGTALGRVDMPRIRLAAEQACIGDFVESALPDGYMTRIGGGGVRLSGGQRQRLAIARALYRNPNLLLLDEATSAVDEATEGEILKKLHASHDRTIVLVTHRIETLRICDQVLIFESGRLAESGAYEALMQTSDLVTCIARASRQDETV